MIQKLNLILIRVIQVKISSTFTKGKSLSYALYYTVFSLQLILLYDLYLTATKQKGLHKK